MLINKIGFLAASFPRLKVCKMTNRENILQ